MILKRSLLLPLSVFLVAALALLGTLLYVLPGGPTGAARVPIGGPFELTDQNGKRLSSESLKGKPSAIFFGFTHCPEVCPTTLFDLTQDLEAMGPDAAKLNVVFITVDPERDTPELMKTYLSSFDPRIVGLTGTEAEITAAAKEYKVYFKKVKTDSGLHHGPHRHDLPDGPQRRLFRLVELPGGGAGAARQAETAGPGGIRQGVSDVASGLEA